MNKRELALFAQELQSDLRHVAVMGFVDLRHGKMTYFR